ncbi:Opi10p Ecym_2627 [Eremothecium cymbalariae DBVPG|uniref:Uncharacterized protein n=1 Tax=Eremothecium cymbalariae (strain CBS 270.75 / DBVPG 7215 / KCTC 17166 / NRRL Y-17582) TaxID=931890 RepID=G8JQK7_ERECY|nr:Hypothetical protein Ecym_2627 [Eremothecium cymbalariae DBVPG\
MQGILQHISQLSLLKFELKLPFAYLRKSFPTYWNMFAAIASGNPLQLSSEVPNSNGLQHTIVLAETKPKSYSHITLFILPNVTIPPEFIAMVYFKLSPDEEFKLFGQLGTNKQSAIFKVKLPNANVPQPTVSNEGLGEIDMEDDNISATDGIHNISELIIGISIESYEQAAAKIEQLRSERTANVHSGTLVVRNQAMSVKTPGQLARIYPVLTLQLASKIVQHAYNYLTGFLDEKSNVPIKKFETWWEKFQKRLENDGTFLDEVTRE